MRFKTDENLPREVAEHLVQSGHDALRVDEQGLMGVADPGIAAVCLVEGRAIVTLDTDFMDIRRFPPEQYSGILVLRPHQRWRSAASTTNGCCPSNICGQTRTHERVQRQGGGHHWRAPAALAVRWRSAVCKTA